MKRGNMKRENDKGEERKTQVHPIQLRRLSLGITKIALEESTLTNLPRDVSSR